MARRGWVWRGWARLGKDYQHALETVCVGFVLARPGAAGRGGAGRGQVRQGMVSHRRLETVGDVFC